MADTCAFGRGLTKLLEISGDALTDVSPVIDAPDWVPANQVAELQALLEAKNGFVAFLGALQVFPAGRPGRDPLDLAVWNADDTWRVQYGGLADGMFCFAEDAFGGQFAITPEGIVVFDPETGETERLGKTLEAWAVALLKDWDYLTGASVAKAWQEQHGRLAFAKRLIPARPFVLGGAYDAANMLPRDRVAAMRARGSLAVHLRDLPNGTAVRLSGYPPPA